MTDVIIALAVGLTLAALLIAIGITAIWEARHEE